MTLKVSFKIERERFQLAFEHEFSSPGITSLFGPSGCGKTTLLRAIAGLDKYQGGQVQLANEVWQDSRTFVPPHKRGIGYVFQDAALFSHLTVEQNLAYARKRAANRAQNPGAGISLAHAIEMLELQALLGAYSDELSGGEKQRVAIARALASNPRLLMLDEPLSAVDGMHRSDILTYLDALHRELAIPIIHVSHDSDEVARLADDVVLIRNGVIRESGAVSDIFSRLDLGLAAEDHAGAVIEATLIEHLEKYQLSRLSFAGQELLVPKVETDAGETVRLKLEARDISLARSRPLHSSILNIIECQVDEVSAASTAGQVTVKLRCGDASLLSRITRKSFDEMNLGVGDRLFAQVKSIALIS